MPKVTPAQKLPGLSEETEHFEYVLKKITMLGESKTNKEWIKLANAMKVLLLYSTLDLEARKKVYYHTSHRVRKRKPVSEAIDTMVKPSNMTNNPKTLHRSIAGRILIERHQMKLDSRCNELFKDLEEKDETYWIELSWRMAERKFPTLLTFAKSEQYVKKVWEEREKSRNARGDTPFEPGALSIETSMEETSPSGMSYTLASTGQGSDDLTGPLDTPSSSNLGSSSVPTLPASSTYSSGDTSVSTNRQESGATPSAAASGNGDQPSKRKPLVNSKDEGRRRKQLEQQETGS